MARRTVVPPVVLTALLMTGCEGDCPPCPEPAPAASVDTEQLTRLSRLKAELLQGSRSDMTVASFLAKRNEFNDALRDLENSPSEGIRAFVSEERVWAGQYVVELQRRTWEAPVRVALAGDRLVVDEDRVHFDRADGLEPYTPPRAVDAALMAADRVV